MTRLLALFLAGSILLWAVAVYPVRWWWGDAAMIQASVALGLCVVPALFALPWAWWALKRSPEQQLAMVLGTTLLRMLAVLGGAGALVTWVESFRRPVFLWSLLGFYLVTLVVEVGLMLASRTADGRR